MADDTPPDDDPIDVALLRAALGGGEDPEPNPQMNSEVERALSALIEAELVEIDEGRRPALIAELATVVGEARSPRDYLKRFVRTIVHSDHVEEIYGSDDELREIIAKVAD
ncbi:MAG: hypothetical protein KC619_15045 [Myxococcales bacterium]|nr:hypothetical protein [Myxococcales bacterium]